MRKRATNLLSLRTRTATLPSTQLPLTLGGCACLRACPSEENRTLVNRSTGGRSTIELHRVGGSGRTNRRSFRVTCTRPADIRFGARALTAAGASCFGLRTTWTCGELNPGPPVCHTGALPTAPQALTVVLLCFLFCYRGVRSRAPTITLVASAECRRLRMTVSAQDTKIHESVVSCVTINVIKRQRRWLPPPLCDAAPLALRLFQTVLIELSAYAART